MSLLLSTLAYALVVQPVRASGVIYIRSDGSIDPPGAPILRNGDLYTLTSSTSSSIIVERDNIIVDGIGYTVQGSAIGNGIELNGRSNVTIRNINVRGFESGVYVSATSRSTILASNVTDNDEGISSYESSNNTISGNNISANIYEGIYLYSSSDNNTISGNNISANVFDGIYLFSSSDNSIFGNNIEVNGYGISPYYSSNNRIFHNNFVNNTFQVNPNSPLDTWDNGYPPGGNYWSDYNGTDQNCGPNQDHPGGDGMGDTPYVIDGNNQDNYPLMNPTTPPSGHNVAVISVVPSKTVIGQGYSGNVTVYGANKGEYTETFNVSIYANTTRITSTALPLESGSTTTVTFFWTPTNTSFSKGNYTISAYAWLLTGEANTVDNNSTDGFVYVGIPGDVDQSRKVDMIDMWLIQGKYGAIIGDPRYVPNYDVDNSGKIDMIDLWITQKHFGQMNP